jgi:hypothetical protein
MLYRDYAHCANTLPVRLVDGSLVARLYQLVIDD